MKTQKVARKALIRPALHPDESARGYAMRLADTNYGINQSSSLFSNRTGSLTLRRINSISELSGIDVNVLVDKGCFKDKTSSRNRTATFNGKEVTKKFVSGQSRRICPECIRILPIMRTEWELLPLTGCPFHGIKLVSHCERCGTHLQWGVGKNACCRCGADFQRFTGVSECESRVLVNMLIVDKLKSPCKFFVKVLNDRFAGVSQLSLCEVLDLVWYLDSIFIPVLIKHTGSRLSTSEDDVLLSVLIDWPHTFQNYVKDVFTDVLLSESNSNMLPQAISRRYLEIGAMRPEWPSALIRPLTDLVINEMLLGVGILRYELVTFKIEVKNLMEKYSL